MKMETHQSLQATIKAVLMGNFIALNAYIRKERSRMISAFTWKKLIMTVEVKQKTLTIEKFN